MGGVQTFIGARDQDRSSQCDANDLRRLRGSVKHPLTALPGVTGVKVSLPRNRVELQFDENRLYLRRDASRIALRGRRRRDSADEGRASRGAAVYDARPLFLAKRRVIASLPT